MKKLLKSEKGLTLIEIIAASVIIVIILTGFVTIFTQGASNTKINEENLVGSNLARDVLEELKTKDFSHIESDVSFDQFNTRNYPTISSVETNGIFTTNKKMKLQLNFTTEQLYIGLLKVNVEILDLSNNPITETYGFVEVDKE